MKINNKKHQIKQNQFTAQLLKQSYQMNQSLQHNPQNSILQNLVSVQLKQSTSQINKNTIDNNQISNLNQTHLKNNIRLIDSHTQMRQSQKIPSLIHHQSHNQKKNQSKTPAQVFAEARKILKKSPQIRTPNDNQLLFQLTQHNDFLAKMVQHISIQCFKGIMKQAKIQQVRQRQLLCEEGKPATHIVVLLDGKLGVCKQQDDFAQQMQGQKTPNMRSSNPMGQSQFSVSKQGKQKQTRTIQTIVQMDNIFDQLTALSCKEIQNIRKRNVQLKRKSSIPITAGLFLPLPYSKEQFEQYQIESYVNPGEEYGGKARCRSKIHTNTCFAVEKSTLLIIQVNSLIYWFEHSFKAKLGETIQKLKKIPAFSFLEDGKLAELILFMKKEKKRRNDYIYKQNSPSDKLYILLHGEVKLCKQAKLFQQNPNQLYVNRRKLMQSNVDHMKKQDQNKRIQALPYANLTSLYNFRPMKKNIDIGIVTSNDECFSLLGDEDLVQKRPRQTDALVISFECEYYEIQTRKIQQLLGSKFIEEFYSSLQQSAKKVILYRQSQYADKVNLQNRQNLDYFYYEDNKSKQSPRKYKLQKINNKFNDTKSNQLFIRSNNDNKNKVFQSQTIKPYYTTFNFHKLVKTQRQSHTRKLSQRTSEKHVSARKRKDSQDSQDIIKMKYDLVEERLIDISHTWKPIKRKVMQQIKVMEKISPKRHSININEPLIEQKYFRDLEKEQKKIDKQHRVFVLSLGKRTKW